MLAVTAFTACKKHETSGNTPAVPNNDGLHIVDGHFLADGAGNKVVLRGVNMGSAWTDGLGMTEIPEIEKTGANAIRFMLQRQSDNSEPAPITAAQIEPLITTCISKGIIPILEIHDFTGLDKDNQGNKYDLADAFNQAVGWWTGTAMKNMLMKYQQSIILNIANEPSYENTSADDYTAVNIDAVKRLRSAGFSCPIMIDAVNWGKSADYFVQSGPTLMDADPIHSLIFSIHTYWPTQGAFGNYSDAQITTNLTNLSKTGLPVVIGEIASVDDQRSDDEIKNNTNPQKIRPINFLLMMNLCQQSQMGYMVFWWGFVKPIESNNIESMSPNGTFKGLTGAGLAFAVTDRNSIMKTSQKAVLK